MTAFYFLAVTLLLWVSKGNSGSPCPLTNDISPCFCSQSADEQTYVLCFNVASFPQLQEMTRSLKSMVIDHFTILDLFTVGHNTTEASGKSRKRLPSKWLNDVRIRAIHIHKANLQNCFLCNNAIVGQEEYLTTFGVKNANLRGRLCYSCNDADSLQLKELPFAAPLLNYLDLSYNDIDTISTKALSPDMKKLKRVVLSHNKISIIEDDAFSTLPALEQLDLSGNEIVNLPKRMFLQSLSFLDLSYNSIRNVPDILLRMPKLKHLKLNDNLITTISGTIWSSAITNLKYLYIEGNYIKCDCSLKGLKEHYKKLFGYCVSPEKFAFQPLAEFVLSEDPCP